MTALARLKQVDSGDRYKPRTRRKRQKGMRWLDLELAAEFGFPAALLHEWIRQHTAPEEVARYSFEERVERLHIFQLDDEHFYLEATVPELLRAFTWQGQPLLSERTATKALRQLEEARILVRRAREPGQMIKFLRVRTGARVDVIQGGAR